MKYPGRVIKTGEQDPVIVKALKYRRAATQTGRRGRISHVGCPVWKRFGADERLDE